MPTCDVFYFRQTQWEPPVADRSPPTPELGYLGDELDSTMDPNLFSSHVPQDVTMVGTLMLLTNQEYISFSGTGFTKNG